MNKDELNIYVLESLKQYGERHQLCPSVSLGNFREWIRIVEQDLALANITDYTPQEILEVFLSVYMKHINPVNDKTEKISKFVCEYCRQWSEMTIVTSQGTNVVRPPYVINGTKPTGTVNYDGVDYYFHHLDSGKKVMVFNLPREVKQKNPDKKDKLEMTVSKADGASSYSFTTDGVNVSPKFKTFEGEELTLKGFEGYEEEDRWFFISGGASVNYVKRGKYLFKITTRLANRYSDDVCTVWDTTPTANANANANAKTKSNYTTWKETVKSKLSGSANDSGKRPAYDYQSYAGEAIGKAHPDTIVKFLRDHCATKNSEQMQAVLNTFCIGADCSGFVSRAIAYVMQNMNWTRLVQFKTIGPLSEASVKEEKGAHTLKLGSKDVLNDACSYYKLYRKKDDTVYDNIYSRDDDKVFNAPITEQAEKNLLSSDLLMGSRLIYRFQKKKVTVEEIVNGKKKKTSKEVIMWDRINKDLTQDSVPQITSLRPGDIVTMSTRSNFEGGFHVAIICYVGIDLDGPYFITADSTPASLKESFDKIKSSHYQVLKRPDPQQYKETVDIKNLSINEQGNGVRYILHRDFGFFNLRPFLAFRRPYAFDLFYRERI